MNFRESLSDNKFKTNESKYQSKQKIKNQQIDKEEFVENVNKYKDLSHNELLNEFMKKTSDLKNRGELSKERVREIYQSLEPILNEEQKKNLADLLNMI